MTWQALEVELGWRAAAVSARTPMVARADASRRGDDLLGGF
jgi:hypothetical protein